MAWPGAPDVGTADVGARGGAVYAAAGAAGAVVGFLAREVPFDLVVAAVASDEVRCPSGSGPTDCIFDDLGDLFADLIVTGLWLLAATAALAMVAGVLAVLAAVRIARRRRRGGGVDAVGAALCGTAAALCGPVL